MVADVSRNGDAMPEDPVYGTDTGTVVTFMEPDQAATRHPVVHRMAPRVAGDTVRISRSIDSMALA